MFSGRDTTSISMPVWICRRLFGWFRESIVNKEQNLRLEVDHMAQQLNRSASYLTCTSSLLRSVISPWPNLCSWTCVKVSAFCLLPYRLEWVYLCSSCCCILRDTVVVSTLRLAKCDGDFEVCMFWGFCFGGYSYHYKVWHSLECLNAIRSCYISWYLLNNIILSLHHKLVND